MELHFSPPNLSLHDQPRSENENETAQALRQSRMAVKETKDTDLVIKTKEGDIVTLSKSSDFESEFSTYSKFYKNGNNISYEKGFSHSLEYSSQYELSVEGDLSKEEIKDINKAIRKLHKAMDQLAKGNTDKALEKAMSLTRLDSISGFEASLTYTASKQYQYSQQTSYERIPDSQEELPKLTDSGKTLLETLTDKLAETVNKTEVPKEKVLPSVNSLFKDMIKQMEDLREEKKAAQNPWDSFLKNLKGRFEDKLTEPYNE